MSKKLNFILAGLLILAVVIIASILVPRYLINHTAMTKSMSSIVEMNDNFIDTGVLVPEFPPGEHDPYAYTSVYDYTLSRSRQGGEWDGYVVHITPTRLSDSQFYQLLVTARPSDENSSQDSEWAMEDLTRLITSTGNYPAGTYANLVKTFRDGPAVYEVSGRLHGEVDEQRKAQAIAELEYLITSMDSVTEVVKQASQ